jgi:hypothetical protein
MPNDSESENVNKQLCRLPPFKITAFQTLVFISSVCLCVHNKTELLLHLLMAHSTSDGKVVITVKLSSAI